MHTNSQTNLRILGKSFPSSEAMKMEKEIQATKNLLLKSTNIEEIKKLVESEANMIILKHFGSEIVVVMMVQKDDLFRLYSIYLDMNVPRAFSTFFYHEFCGTKDIKLKKNGTVCEVYCDDVLHTKSYIYHGDEITSDICIKFPSGMAGNGGWDFSGEFKLLD